MQKKISYRSLVGKAFIGCLWDSVTWLYMQAQVMSANVTWFCILWLMYANHNTFHLISACMSYRSCLKWCNCSCSWDCFSLTVGLCNSIIHANYNVSGFISFDYACRSCWYICRWGCRCTLQWVCKLASCLIYAWPLWHIIVKQIWFSATLPDSWLVMAHSFARSGHA